MTEISRRIFLKLGVAAAAGTVATVAVPGAAENAAKVGRLRWPACCVTTTANRPLAVQLAA